MARIDVEDVVVVYEGGIRALDGIDLHVADGEFMAVLGPSGSGKTTLARVIAGLEKPTSGTIRLDGADITRTAAHRRGIAMVFQDGALYPHLTAERNMGFPLRVRKRGDEEIDRRVGEVAATLTLTQYLQRRPGELSAGHRHGVATGRAMLGEGGLLLMDEPLAHLDSGMRHRIRTELRQRTAVEDVTIVYATNDQEDAMVLADRMTVIDRGKVRQVGTPAEVYHRPTDTFVAGFVGSPPMNLVDAAIAADGTGAVVSLGTRRLDVSSATLAQTPQLRSFFGGPVTIGIRPEHLRYGGASDVTDEQRIGGEVVQVEFVGSDRHVHFVAEDGAAFVARLPVEGDVRVGAHIALGVDEAQMRFFDAGSGAAIA